MRHYLVVLWVGLLACIAPSFPATRAELVDRSELALNTLYHLSPDAQKLVQDAKGVLIFPEVVKAGFGIGGEYGEGTLQIQGKTERFYNVASASIGFQLGVQTKAQVILFMSQKALDNFLKSNGWEVGVDGGVALVTIGVGGKLDTKMANQAVIGFIFSNKGLMYNLTFEGSKISQIHPK